MTIKRVLYTFWIVIPILIVVSLLLYSMSTHYAIANLLQTIPSIALVFLLCFKFFLYAYCLYTIDNTENYHMYLTSFLLVSSIQQLLTLNFIGALLCFHYFRQLPKQPLRIKSLLLKTKWVGVIVMILSFVTLLLMWSLYLKNLYY